MAPHALYLRLISASLREQLQHRASTFLTALGLFLISVADYIGIWALFNRFGSIQGWTLAEVALFFGIINISFALAETVAPGFDFFSRLVRNGDFDRMLLRPRSTALLVASHRVRLDRLSRGLQGAIILVWAAAQIQVGWSAAKLALLLFSIVGGAALFFGLFVVQATIVFWTVETLEIVNIMTNGGVETAQYPLSIYRSWFRRFFTFVIPLACVNYYPLHAILERPDPLGSPVIFQWTAPLLCFAFLAIALSMWNYGTRRYVSTGS